MIEVSQTFEPPAPNFSCTGPDRTDRKTGAIEDRPPLNTDGGAIKEWTSAGIPLWFRA
jgi:hypothetical protein